MAELQVDGDELVLQLSGVEKVEGVHGDLRAPLSAVQAVEVLDDAHGRVGIRSGIKVGTRIPGVIEVGTIHGRTKKLFAAVHHDTPRGVLVRFEGADFDEWVVGCADPEGVVRTLRLPSH
jgi:hypothetical protein